MSYAAWAMAALAALTCAGLLIWRYEMWTNRGGMDSVEATISILGANSAFGRAALERAAEAATAATWALRAAISAAVFAGLALLAMIAAGVNAPERGHK